MICTTNLNYWMAFYLESLALYQFHPSHCLQSIFASLTSKTLCWFVSEYVKPVCNIISSDEAFQRTWKLPPNGHWKAFIPGADTEIALFTFQLIQKAYQMLLQWFCHSGCSSHCSIASLQLFCCHYALFLIGV